MAAEHAWIPSVRLKACSDEELVHCARHGSLEAVEELLARYRGMVEGKARVFFVAGAEPEDVVQEGMIGLVKAIRDFSTAKACSFRYFAELCVNRQIISAVKAGRRHKHLMLNNCVSLDASGEEDQESTGVGEPPAGDQFRPERVLMARLMVMAIRRLISQQLSSLERQALIGHLAGLSYRQIGRELSCGVKAVDNALQRSKKKLARVLGEVL
ncbi:MAG: sigma-70 family RNA polymerase sigma factor [Armatimonadetes bacterium]|nr:sigma-70 family RNA polymerase sigma factor [Armatimonadota bacterium]